MTIEAADLKIDLQERDGWRRTLNVTVPAAKVSAERRKIAHTLAGRMKMPGFRAGKIPAAVVEKRYGPALNREMLDRVIGEAYKQALQTQALNPISEGEVEDVTYEPEKDLTFSISFDVRPEFEVGRLGGFALERPGTDVGDEELDKVLHQLRDQNGSWEPLEGGTAETGELVSLKVQKLVDGEPEGDPQEYELVLGEGDAIPDVESAIYTLEVGGTDEFTVTFPDDFPNEQRRGEVQHLRITLVGRKARRLPELDDDFARTLGEFEDLGALRARVREDLTAEAEEQAEMAVRRQLMQHLLEANDFKVPRSMVERYTDSVLGDTEDVDEAKIAQAREQILPEAERAVKRILIIERVADTQDLRASEEEIDERIEAIAEKNGTNPAEIYARFQKSGRIEMLEREITEGKVFEFLKSKSEIVPARS